MNFGALCRDDGANISNANYTLWRNAVYSLAGLEVPITPVYMDTLVPEATLYTSNVTVESGKSFNYPVYVDNLDASNPTVISYQFEFYYDDERLTFNDLSSTNTLSSSGTVAVNSNTPGVLYVSYMNDVPLDSSGVLLNLNFKTQGQGATYPYLSNGLLNTEPVSISNDGVVFIVYNNYGDVDNNELIQAYDAALTLQFSVGLDPLPLVDPLPWEDWRLNVANVDGVAGISANDAALILQHSVYLINSFPVESYLRSAVANTAGIIITQEDNQLVFKSKGNLIGLNIFALSNKEVLGTPNVIATGIVTINQPELRVYPNPTTDILQISQLEKGATLSVYDLSGRLLLQQTASSSTETLSVGHLNNGLYQLVIDANGIRTFTKFVKR
jgi:hypothetical protein